MKPRDVFSYSFSAIKLRKFRASLTTLGVVIGIAAIVALLSLGQGFQVAITAQLEKGFATDTLIVTPGGGQGGFGQGGFGQGGASSFPLFVNDSQMIEKIGNVTLVVPIIQKACYLNSTTKTYLLNVEGVDFAKYKSIYGNTFVAGPNLGSIPSNPDNESIVIGARVHDPWKNGTDIINVNDRIEIKYTTVSSGFTRENKTYTGHVVAVLGEIGGFNIGGPSDTGVYTPISQAQDFFATEEVQSMIVQLKNSNDATIKDTSDAIRNAFSNHVTVISSTAVLGTIQTIFSFIEIFLAGIGGISLLVAGIGIMNIMIVSLMERTREIGILKALGMNGRTVLLIFLAEAVIIGLIGGVIGIAAGWGLAEVFARFGFSIIGGGAGGAGFGGGGGVGGGGGGLSITPVLTPMVFVGALSFGLIVSVVFAVYPAWRASKLKPVEALRYE
jgi:putative ABC transport system permease protein